MNTTSRPYLKNTIIISILIVSFLSLLLHAYDFFPYSWTFQYSDIVPMFTKADHVPFAEQIIEYPVLTRLIISWSALIGSTKGYYLITGILLILAALAATIILSKLSPKGTLQYWTLAPSMLFFLIYNWDIFAVLCVVAALYAESKGKILWATFFIAIGFLFKFYPAIYLLPLLIMHAKEWKKIILVFSATVLIISAPFILINKESWLYFFTFSSSRMPNYDSIWYIAGRISPLSVSLINILSLSLFLLLIGVILYRKVWKKQATTFTELSFLFTLCFLLTNKVFSPQFILWLLPFFTLFAIDKAMFYLLETANLFTAIFILSFGFIDHKFLAPALFFVVVRHMLLAWLLYSTLTNKAES